MAEVEIEVRFAGFERTRSDSLEAAEMRGLHRGTLRDRLRTYAIDATD